MIIGVIKETKEYENRVALSPEVVKLVRKKGFEVVVESGAGEKSFFSNQDYEAAGATIGTSKEALGADLVLKVNLATVAEIAQMKENAGYISYMYAYQYPEILEAFNKKRITTFSMDAVPRISRAQKMDALSSQANLAGYKAVLLGANYLGKIFPLLMTASGTITPARVLIFGAGVAGLQAIATAKRLGAVVECTDVRPETKEQVESLGGRYLSVEGVEGVKTEGGYAREVSAEYLEKQQGHGKEHEGRISDRGYGGRVWRQLCNLREKRHRSQTWSYSSWGIQSSLLASSQCESALCNQY